MDNSDRESLAQARADWQRVKCDFYALKMLFAGRRWIAALEREAQAAREAKYAPDQPRVPAGSSDGGQWTSGGSGVGAGGGVSADNSDGTPVQLAFAQAYPIEKAVEAALLLFSIWASQNSQETTAALEFRAQEFLPGAKKEDPAIGVRNLTRDEVDEACPRHGLVQSITDEAATRVREEGNYWGAAVYGTKVHAEIKRQVNNRFDPNFRAEVSTIKSDEVRYGKKESIRIDVLERVGDGTVCVYDIKTGESRLTVARMGEIAANAHKLFVDTKRILVIETRPK